MSSGEPTSTPPPKDATSAGAATPREVPPVGGGVPPRVTGPGADLPGGPAPTGATPAEEPVAAVPPVTPPAAEPGARDTPATGAAQQGGAEWPAQAADAVVDLVGRVRDATTGPVLTVMRGVVYGTAILILGITALVILVVGAIRTLDTLLPQEVWSAYLLLGLVFTAVGLVLWRKRRSPESA